MKIRVLIPSDNRDFVAELAWAYAQAGCDVVTGAFNFDLRLGGFDLVHYQWPEEFCGWTPPSDRRVAEIVDGVRWWNKRCSSVVSVHNLWPHGYFGHPKFRAMFDEFYGTCTRLLHFSQTSKTRLLAEFASARHGRHVVTHLWNFDRTVSLQPSRGSCRVKFGLADDNFVILVLGALRTREEVGLISRAFERCRVPNKRLLMAGRFNEEASARGRRWRKLRWKAWLWKTGAVVREAFVPDEELSRYLDSADVVVVPRSGELNSGIPSLAASFGTPIVAPDVGVFAEALAGTENALYNPGDAQSLANAIEAMAERDRAEIRRANRRLADRWDWPSIVSECLASLRAPAAVS